MKQLPAFLLGAILITALFSAVTLFAQDDRLGIRPIIVDVQQSIPIMADVSLPTGDDVITTTLPLTVDVDLRIVISGEDFTVITPTRAATVKVITTGEELTDDLGLSYTVDIPDELTLNEWTVYENTYGNISVFGEVALSADSEPMENDIQCIVRFYKAGKLVNVEEIVNVGYYLKPGRTNAFEGNMSIEPGEVDSYTVTFKIQ